MELEVNADSANDPGNNGAPVQSGTLRGPQGYSDVTTDPDDFERGYRAEEVLGTLKNAAGTLGGVRGRRKALLFFSEGIDYPIYDVFGLQAATDVLNATKDAIAAAARANVSFYTIYPRGLVGLSSEEIELNASADPSRGFDAHGLLAEMRLSQDSLRVILAVETGGSAAVNSRTNGRAHFRPHVLREQKYLLRARLLSVLSIPATERFHQDRGARHPARACRCRPARATPRRAARRQNQAGL